MKNRFLFLLTILLANLLFAQTENYKIAIDDFQINYNSGDYEKIFNNFSTEMKEALPLESTQQFFAGLLGIVLENKFSGISSEKNF
jgi:hypothetical protein